MGEQQEEELKNISTEKEDVLNMEDQMMMADEDDLIDSDEDLPQSSSTVLRVERKPEARVSAKSDNLLEDGELDLDDVEEPKVAVVERKASKRSSSRRIIEDVSMEDSKKMAGTEQKKLDRAARFGLEE